MKHLAAVLAAGLLTAAVAGQDRPGPEPVAALTPGVKPLRGLAFSPDGRLLAVVGPGDGGRHAAVELRTVPAGEGKAAFKLDASWGESVAFSPDGRLLAVGGGELYHGDVTVLDAGTGKTAWSRKDVATTSFVRVAFSPDGKLLAGVGDAGSRADPLVRIWDARTGAPLRTWKGHRLGVTTAAFSADGRVLATGGADGAVKLWDVGTGELKRSMAAESKAPPGDARVVTVAFSPDGKVVAAGSDPRDVRLWDVETGALRRAPENTVRPTALAFSPDGSLLAAGGHSPTVTVWDAGSGQVRGTLRAAAQRVPSLAFAPDGKTLATGGDEGVVRLWDVSKLAGPKSGR